MGVTSRDFGDASELGGRPGVPVRGLRRTAALLLSAAALAPAGIPGQALAQQAGASVASEPLANALRRLARQRGIEILFSPNLVKGRQVRAASLRGSPDAVLARLLQGSGIEFRRTPDGTYYLVRGATRARPPPSPRRALPPELAAPPAQVDHAPIIVTARKREELLLETPIAISAFSARQIRESGSRKLEDLIAYAPGVYFTQQGFLRPGRVDANVRFRGMSVNTGTPQEQLAKVFIDGVPVSDGIQSLSLEDAERVEVISGPQSAIFGRSTFGGAINIITRVPSEQPMVRTDAIVQTNGDLDLNGSVEGPIVRGVLAGRLSGRILRSRGDYRNPVVPDHRLGRQATDSLAGNLRLTLRDFTASARLRYAHDDDGPPAGWALGFAESNCGPFGAGTRPAICGSLPGFGPARFGQNTDDAPTVAELLRQGAVSRGFTLDPPDEYGMKRTTWNGSFHLGLVIPSANLRLEANGGFNRRRRSVLADSDQGPDRVTMAFYPMRSRDKSLEVRVRSQASTPFKWSLGAAYFDQRHHENVEGVYGALVLPTSYNPVCTVAPVDCDPATLRPDARDLYLGTLPYFIGHVTTKAVFGSAEVALFRGIDAGLELRREWDRVEDSTLPNGPLAENFATWLYRGVLSAHPIDGSTFYVSASNGNLPGRFNASVIGASASAREQLAKLGVSDTLPQQSLNNLEAGFKLKRDDFSLSLVAYRMVWRRQRIRQTFFDAEILRTISYLSADGSSRLRGLELQASWRPAQWLSIGLVADVADARYMRQSSLVALRVLGDADVSGNNIPGSPRYSGTLTATVTGNRGGRHSWYARGDLFYRGRVFLDELNLASLPAVVTLNARAGTVTDGFGIELFVTNLLQSRVPRFAAPQTDISAYVRAFDFTYPGFITEAAPTRKLGLRVTKTF